jgi:hypothetical protein
MKILKLDYLLNVFIKNEKYFIYIDVLKNQEVI